MTRIAALSLYKSILRAHASLLPPQMRQLGDAYVKSEFRQHKSVTNPEQLQEFFTAWENYLEQIKFSARAKDSLSAGSLSSSSAMGQRGGGDESSSKFFYGRPLPEDAEMNEDQMEKLKSLEKEAKRLGSSSPKSKP